MPTDNPHGFKVPAAVAPAADRWYTLMQKRLTLQREADEVEKEEKYLKAWIIDNLPRSRATGTAGKLVRVQIAPKTRYEIKNADEFFAYIAKNRLKGAFALLNRAVNAKAAGEYWDAGKRVPGLEQVPYKSISYSAIPGAKK